MWKILEQQAAFKFLWNNKRTVMIEGTNLDFPQWSLQRKYNFGLSKLTLFFPLAQFKCDLLDGNVLRLFFSDYLLPAVKVKSWCNNCIINKMVREQKNTFKEETELIPSKSTNPVLDSHRVLRFVNEVPRSLFIKKKKAKGRSISCVLSLEWAFPPINFIIFIFRTL